MKATNIKWDVDCDSDGRLLPTEIEIPAGMEDEDEITDYLSDVTGICHDGYELIKNEEHRPYRIAITETYVKEVEIFALSSEEAEQKANDLCAEGTINFDFENFVDRSTECRGVARPMDLDLHEVFGKEEKTDKKIISQPDRTNSELNKIFKTIKNQLENRENETSFGEPQAWASLNNGRSIEVVLEQEGLEEKDYYFSVRLHCNEEEYNNHDYHRTDGIIDKYNSKGQNLEELKDILSAALVCNKRYPVAEHSLPQKSLNCLLGRSLFIGWEQLDNVVNRWAKSYFGEHVAGFGEREETDLYIGFSSLKQSDYEKYAMLFDKYDRENDYDAAEEFLAGLQYATMPCELTLKLLHDILPNQDLRMCGTVVATENGVFVMENSLSESVDLIPPPSSYKEQSSLDAKIQEARTQAERLGTSVQKEKDLLR